MSNFDENPFADPEATNPFADPSVRQNTWNQQQPGQGGLDDFNPFADGNTQTRSTPVAPPQAPAPTQPAVMQPTQEPPPPYSAQAQAGTDDLKRRQEELERKAAELKRKEQELQRNLGQAARVDNFPPLPEKCCVKPCFYQDFELDIPLEFQKIVKTVYYIWISYCSLLFLNVIGALAYFIAASRSGGGNGSAGTTFGVSILYLVLFTPCSFVCWYRPLYKAFRSDSSFNFFFFFFVFFFQFCISVLQALGIAGWGTVGYIVSLTVLAAGYHIEGTIMMIISVLHTLFAIISLGVWIKVHRIYRSTGASFAKAQEEFAKGVMSNKNVQSAASTAGQAAVRNAMSGDNRY